MEQIKTIGLVYISLVFIIMIAAFINFNFDIESWGGEVRFGIMIAWGLITYSIVWTRHVK